MIFEITVFILRLVLTLKKQGGIPVVETFAIVPAHLCGGDGGGGDGGGGGGGSVFFIVVMVTWIFPRIFTST